MTNVQNSSISPGSISVLITTYNGELFIEDQLRSILNQTRRVSQVLVFDDGSTDQTVSLIERFISENSLLNWSVEINEVNLGPSQNVLRHLSRLDGETVFLADQDDVWAPNKVEVLCDFLSSHPECSLAVSSSHLVDADGQISEDAKSLRALHRRSRTHRVGLNNAETLNIDDFLGYSSVPLHAMCVRGNVIQSIGSRERFPELSHSVGADWYIGIRSTILGACFLIPDKLVYRRVHDANISLGSLRKTTVLSGTQERRLTTLKQTRDAHVDFLSDSSIDSQLGAPDREAAQRLVAFLNRRIQYAQSPSITNALGLLKDFGLYHQSAGTVRGAARMWVADVMYAYNINWTIKKRA